MELFLHPEGKGKGDKASDPAGSFPTLSPESTEQLMVWLHPGFSTTSSIDLSGWKFVRIMPYVPDPKYGGGARLIRDWEPELGDKPYIKTLTIRGSSFSILHLKVDTLNTDEQKGTLPSSPEAEDGEPAFTILKGVEGTTWNADDWEVTLGTIDDIKFDTVNLGTSTGVDNIVLTENTDHEGKPKGNLQIKRWNIVKGKMKEGKRLQGDKLGQLNISLGGEKLQPDKGYLKADGGAGKD